MLSLSLSPKNFHGDLNVAFLGQLSHAIQLRHERIAAKIHTFSLKQYPQNYNLYRTETDAKEEVQALEEMKLRSRCERRDSKV